jgi:Na+/alanine symporter
MYTAQDLQSFEVKFIYLFIMLCQFHTIISTQIQTQEYTNYQSINGRVYATALRQLYIIFIYIID